MRETIKHIDGNRLLLEIDKTIYNAEAVLNASCKFTDRCYIHQEPASENIINVYFQEKENNSMALDKIANEFCNELIDQQIRINVEKEYGSIRDMIVKKAFSPITSK